jgi:hypothetical protein
LKNLEAFQRLWNRNKPNEKIPEDGKYGEATANAFNKAPCNGWVSVKLNETSTSILNLK